MGSRQAESFKWLHGKGSGLGRRTREEEHAGYAFGVQADAPVAEYGEERGREHAHGHLWPEAVVHVISKIEWTHVSTHA